MNATESVMPQPHPSKKRQQKQQKKHRVSRRAAPMQPIDPDVYIGTAAPLQPPSKKDSPPRPRRAMFIPADGGDMGFSSAEFSAISAPLEDDEDDGMIEPEIDFYQDERIEEEREADEDTDTVVEYKQTKKDTKQKQKHQQRQRDDDDDDDYAFTAESSSVSIDLGIYIISGLFLILLMEQFIQLGMRMRS
jgi:hypothetical protein